MTIEITKRFEKEASKLNKALQHKLADLLDDLEQAKAIDQVNNLKKLVGFDNAYRIRIGDYRVGLLVEGDTVIVSRVLHRRDMYRYFP